MSEKGLLFTTGATGDGATAYTQAEVIRWQRQFFCGADNEGVAKDYLNELATTGVASPVATNTGAAFVRGFPYWNTASVDTAIPTPSANTRIDRLVLRANWSAQTVRITRIAGTEGTGNPPSIVQTDGTTWDVPLCQASITTGGVITVTDEREFLHPNIAVDEDMLDTSVAGDGLAGGDGSALSVNVDDSTIETSGDALRVKDAGITLPKMHTNSVDSPQYVDGSIDTVHVGDLQITLPKLAANSVDDTKAGNRVPQFYRRQGGSATIWTISGTTTYTPTAVRMQAGCLEWTGSAAAYNYIILTFPTAFAYAPIVIPTIYSSSDAQNDISVAIQSPSTTQVYLCWVDTGGGTHTTVKINWLAIGPE